MLQHLNIWEKIELINLHLEKGDEYAAEGNIKMARQCYMVAYYYESTCEQMRVKYAFKSLVKLV